MWKSKYFTYEGYEWKKEAGILNVKRGGVNFRIFFKGDDNVTSTSLWVQYGTKLDEDLNHMHWAGQITMVNVRSDVHSSLVICIDTENHGLWVHYRADIHSLKEFVCQSNGAYSEMKSLMNNYGELLPKLPSDFPIQDKKKNPGFS